MSRRREPAGIGVASSIIRIATRRGVRPSVVAVPPSLTTVCSPFGAIAVSTATRCDQPVVTRCGQPARGAPSCSSRRRGELHRADDLAAGGDRLAPAEGELEIDVARQAQYFAVFPVHGSGASSTGAARSIPFGSPLRKRSNHELALEQVEGLLGGRVRRRRVAEVAEVEPLRAFQLLVRVRAAWSIPNAKSRRPWSMKSRRLQRGELLRARALVGERMDAARGSCSRTIRLRVGELGRGAARRDRGEEARDRARLGRGSAGSARSRGRSR